MANLNIKNQVRFFNTIEIIDDHFIKKTSSLSIKFIDEIQWFINIKNKFQNLLPFIPEIKECNLKNNPYIIYKLISFETLHSIFVNLSTTNWKTIVDSYKCLLTHFKKVSPNIYHDKIWKSECTYMYIDKTIERLEKLKTLKQFSYFFNKKKWIYINNKKFPSIDNIITYLQKIKKNTLKKSIFYSICTPNKKRISFFHGDLCFSNCFFDNINHKIICIDPRGAFGNQKIFGDILFEYAKIYESIFGLYDFVIEDKFKLTQSNKNINYKIFYNRNIESIQMTFLNLFPQKNIHQIKLIESLQFLCMIPFHADHPNRQIVFLCHGIIRFWEIIKSEWK
jgi:hypothetical protein